MADTKQLMIQRLVDGELDRQQVRKLLHQAESESPMYRQMALAMIENQIWEREIRQLDAGMTDVGDGSIADNDSSTKTPRVGRSSQTFGTDDFVRPQRNYWPQGSGFLALAMVALLMTWLGYSAGQWRTSIGPAGQGQDVVQSPAGNANANRMASNAGTGVKQISEDQYAQYSPYRMQMVSNDSGLKSDEAFPVLPISTARELGVKYEPIQASGDLQQRLNSQGFELWPEIQLIHVQMDDGRQIVVPVQRMQLRQWGQ